MAQLSKPVVSADLNNGSVEVTALPSNAVVAANPRTPLYLWDEEVSEECVTGWSTHSSSGYADGCVLSVTKPKEGDRSTPLTAEARSVEVHVDFSERNEAKYIGASWVKGKDVRATDPTFPIKDKEDAERKRWVLHGRYDKVGGSVWGERWARKAEIRANNKDHKMDLESATGMVNAFAAIGYSLDDNYFSLIDAGASIGTALNAAFAVYGNPVINKENLTTLSKCLICSGLSIEETMNTVAKFGYARASFLWTMHNALVTEMVKNDQLKLTDEDMALLLGTDGVRDKQGFLAALETFRKNKEGEIQCGVSRIGDVFASGLRASLPDGLLCEGGKVIISGCTELLHVTNNSRIGQMRLEHCPKLQEVGSNVFVTDVSISKCPSLKTLKGTLAAHEEGLKLYVSGAESLCDIGIEPKDGGILRFSTLSISGAPRLTLPKAFTADSALIGYGVRGGLGEGVHLGRLELVSNSFFDYSKAKIDGEVIRYANFRVRKEYLETRSDYEDKQYGVLKLKFLESKGIPLQDESHQDLFDGPLNPIPLELMGEFIQYMKESFLVNEGPIWRARGVEVLQS